MLALPEVRVAEPVRHHALSVFPLFGDAPGAADYLLSEEAISGGVLGVEEVNEGGSVPDLLVDNRADALVLFVEGEELRGAKQNRVLNTSVLIAAHSKTKIPVSCVERGRWHYRSRLFSSGGHSSSHLRYILKKTVTHSSREGHGHRSDQGEVWKEVDRQRGKLQAPASPTAAMSDTYDAFQDRLDEFRDRLKYVEGAAGLAVAVGGKLASVDLFDKPATCRKVWDRLLTGVVLDALEAEETAEQPGEDAVRGALAALRDAAWQPAPSVGAGRELRAELGDDHHASALTLGDAVVHASLVLAV